MELTNEKIAAMAAWTLEDIQEDPLGAVEQVRALASAYQDLQKERDVAVKDIETLMSKISSADACGYCERDGNGCHSNFGATSCRPKWCGPKEPLANPPQAEKRCGNCRWHDSFTWVCTNGDSEKRADMTDEDFSCGVWEACAAARK